MNSPQTNDEQRWALALAELQQAQNHANAAARALCSVAEPVGGGRSAEGR